MYEKAIQKLYTEEHTCMQYIALTEINQSEMPWAPLVFTCVQ